MIKLVSLSILSSKVVEPINDIEDSLYCMLIAVQDLFFFSPIAPSNTKQEKVQKFLLSCCKTKETLLEHVRTLKQKWIYCRRKAQCQIHL